MASSLPTTEHLNQHTMCVSQEQGDKRMRRVGSTHYSSGLTSVMPSWWYVTEAVNRAVSGWGSLSLQ